MFVFFIHITFRFTCQLKVDAYKLPQEINCMYGSHVRGLGQPGIPVRSFVALAGCTTVRALWQVQFQFSSKCSCMCQEHLWLLL